MHSLPKGRGPNCWPKMQKIKRKLLSLFYFLYLIFGWFKVGLFIWFLVALTNDSINPRQPHTHDGPTNQKMEQRCPGGMPKKEYCAQAVEEKLSGHSSCTHVMWHMCWPGTETGRSRLPSHLHSGTRSSVGDVECRPHLCLGLGRT